MPSPPVPPQSLPERARSLLGELAAEKDAQRRFSRLVEAARLHPPLPDALRIPKHLVPGCQVRLWWIASLAGTRCQFAADSDALTLKALTQLLARVYSGATPGEILAHPPRFLDDLGLLRPLAENRQATVRRVADRILAFACHAQSHPPASPPP